MFFQLYHIIPEKINFYVTDGHSSPVSTVRFSTLCLISFYQKELLYHSKEVKLPLFEGTQQFLLSLGCRLLDLKKTTHTQKQQKTPHAIQKGMFDGNFFIVPNCAR